MAGSGSGKQGMSGPKGFAVAIGGMLLIMLVLWGIAAMVAP
ncbi:hypothetical protein [Actinomadura sp. B10D3]